MRKTFIVITVIVGAGFGISYLYILAYLQNKRLENHNVALALSAAPIDPNLPNVLIIGDSISVSYTYPVRHRLEGIANVIRPLENCGSTLMILDKLDQWLGTTRWAVIHFNSGLHDLKHVQYENIAPEKAIAVPVDRGPRWISPDSYRANLMTIVERLKKMDAKLIFATTTPVPTGEANRVPEDVALYNETARAVMRENNVEIDDLNSVVVESAYRFQKPKDVHFTQIGSDILADHVAANIKAVLTARP